jgi:hypothetical protein
MFPEDTKTNQRRLKLLPLIEKLIKPKNSKKKPDWNYGLQLMFMFDLLCDDEIDKLKNNMNNNK